MSDEKQCVARKEGFTQVCVWPGTIVQPEEVPAFEKMFLDEMKTRVQFLETILTAPDFQNGSPVEGTGGRQDVFLAVHTDDIGKFSILRLPMRIRWIEDVIADINGGNVLYPARVKEYKTW